MNAILFSILALIFFLPLASRHRQSVLAFTMWVAAILGILSILLLTNIYRG